MSKVPLAQRVGAAATPATPAATPTTAATTAPTPTPPAPTPAAKRAAPARPVVTAQVVRVYGGRGAAVTPAREPARSGNGQQGEPPPPLGFEWGLSC